MYGCEGNGIEKEPKCGTNKREKHDYMRIRAWTSGDNSFFKYQCQACMIVRVEEYTLTEILCSRRFEKPGRLLRAGE